jgi:peptidoglycan hydrolase CwlO-like protein
MSKTLKHKLKQIDVPTSEILKEKRKTEREIRQFKNIISHYEESIEKRVNFINELKQVLKIRESTEPKVIE